MWLKVKQARLKPKSSKLCHSGMALNLTISRGVQELLKIVDDNPDREWKEDELLLVEQVHAQLELALENANLFQQTQIALSETDERARQLRLLNQMSNQINQTEDLIEIYNIAAEKAKEIFKVERASVTLITEDQKQLETVAVSGTDSGILHGALSPIANSPNEMVIRENRVFIPPNLSEIDMGEIKSSMGGPIGIANNVIGTLTLDTKIENAFNDRDANSLTQLLSLVNASVENRRLFEQIETLSLPQRSKLEVCLN